MSQNETSAEQLAKAVLSLADTAGMPDSFWQTDSRVKLARDVLDVPEDGRDSHAHLWEGNPLPDSDEEYRRRDEEDRRLGIHRSPEPVSLEVCPYCGIEGDHKLQCPERP